VFLLSLELFHDVQLTLAFVHLRREEKSGIKN